MLKIKFLLNKKFFYLILFFSLICLNKCLVEIPLKAIEVNGVAKYKNIKIKKFESIKSNNNLSMLIDEGLILVNQNYLFITTVYIGSDNQPFNLLLDTKTELLWVAEIGSSDNGTINHYYNPNTSLTSYNTEQPFMKSYRSINCNGYLYTDELLYINNKRFQMTFGVANQTVFDFDNADGIIGLPKRYSDENFLFMNMLQKYNVTDSKIFSFKIEGNFSKAEGKLYIGKHKDFDDEKAHTCPLIEFSNEENNIFWACKLDGFSIRKGWYEIKSSKNFTMLFDSAINIIILPMDYLNDLKSKLSKVDCSEYSEDGKNYILKCTAKDDALPDFRFKINGKFLTLPYNYVFYKENNDYYTIIYFSETHYCTIGTPFFFAFHTLFDNDNEELHFYSSSLIEEEKKGKKFKIIVTIIYVVIIVIVLLVCIIHCCKKRKQANIKNENEIYNNYHKINK